MSIGSTSSIGTDNTGASEIPAISANLALLMADVGDASASALGSIYGILGNPVSSISTVIGGNIIMPVGGGSAAADQSIQSMVRYIVDNLGSSGSTNPVPAVDSVVNTHVEDVVGNKGDTAVTVVDATSSLMAYIKGLIGSQSPKAVGRVQIAQAAVTCASNAAPTILLTVTDGGCLVKNISLYVVSPATGDLTSLKISDSGPVAIFIDDVAGSKANLDAAKEQVGWEGSIYLPIGETINVVPTGTGATALDLLLVVEYEAVVDGGYLA